MEKVQETRAVIKFGSYLYKAINYQAKKLSMNKTAIVLMGMNEYFDKHLSKEKRKELEELSNKGSGN